MPTGTKGSAVGKPTKTVEELLASAPAPELPPNAFEESLPEELRPTPMDMLFGEKLKPRPRARPHVRIYRRQDGKRH